MCLQGRNGLMASLLRSNTECQRLRVEVTDDPVLQGTLRFADAGAVMRHGTRSKRTSLKELERRQTGVVFPYARIVEDAQHGPGSECIAGRTQAAVGAADGNAALILRAQLGDGVNDT